MVSTCEGSQYEIPLKIDNNTTLGAYITRCTGSTGLVVFAHGSGSSRHSTRNQYVAKQINNKGVSTLLADLLTTQEEQIDNRTAELRFNIQFLTQRLNDITDAYIKQSGLHNLKIGLFGASTGAAAALNVAGLRSDVYAVVSRGGRADLADVDILKQLNVPTLLLVGGNDGPVITMNQTALSRMTVCNDKQLIIIPNATHLFPEPGTLQKVAELAANFFDNKLHGTTP